MIVNIAAWFYLLNAGLALLSSLLSPLGLMSGSPLIALIYAGLLGAMGVGLLKRAKWGRFLALGCSLLGWTLGALVIIGLLGYLLVAAPLAMLFGVLFMGGLFAVLAWIAFLSLLLWLFGVVLSFKLFWHLCSPEGCEEFGEPPISARPVIASTGAWLALAFINFFIAGSGQFMSGLPDPGVAHDPQENAAQAGAADAVPDVTEASEVADTGEEAGIPAIPEAADEPEEESAPAVSEEPVVNNAEPVVTESPAAGESPAADESESETASSRKVIKCRDSAGAVTFTQGYCPPGTRKVDME